ncbi:hypothetical protein CWI36_0633p0020 [Hamiltosporidium magnivora]|uniref:Anaphase-promoting complex subunit 4-like WD40 domain-containing protein n=1 Tax=Hamiltosporidium magnivora TaxID=148818 RepID=A0A4Q9LEG6_9MICR|nr:hypothetical protein CWI36_0633p0020 [Hamiltosporidium magnivora]
MKDKKNENNLCLKIENIEEENTTESMISNKEKNIEKSLSNLTEVKNNFKTKINNLKEEKNEYFDENRKFIKNMENTSCKNTDKKIDLNSESNLLNNQAIIKGKEYNLDTKNRNLIIKNGENIKNNSNKTVNLVTDGSGDGNSLKNEVGMLNCTEKNKSKKLLREDFGDPSSMDFKGPWARFIDTEIQNLELDRIKMIKEEIDWCLRMKNPFFVIGSEKSKYYGNIINNNKISANYLRRPIGYNKYLEHSIERIPKVCDLTITDHIRSVRKVLFLKRYSNLLLSGGLDGKICLIESFEEKKTIRTFLGHSKGISGILSSTDGKTMISGSYDGFVKEWDIETGRCKRRIETKDYVTGLAGFSNDYFYVGCYDGSIKLNICLNNDNTLVCSFENKSLKVLENNFKIFKEYKNLIGYSSLSINLIKKNIFFREGSESLKFLDLNTFEILEKTIKIFPDNGIYCELGVSPNGQRIFSGDKNGKAYFYDWDTGKCVRNIQMHTDAIRCMAWNEEDVSKFATGGDDNFLHLWN